MRKPVTGDRKTSGDVAPQGSNRSLTLATLLAIQMAGQRAAAPTWKIVALLAGIAGATQRAFGTEAYTSSSTAPPT